MFKWLSKQEEDLLPWYVNHSLTPFERWRVRRWLRGTPDATREVEDWRRLQAAVRSQPQAAPPQAVWRGVQARTRRRGQESDRVRNWPRRAWALGSVLALLVIALLWGIIQPGIVLQWSTSDAPLTGFRVYRARAGSDDYTLLYETAADAEMRRYTYVDVRPLPGQAYVYRVEGVGEGAAVSRSITANGLQALPSQAAILLVGIIVGYTAVILTQQLPIRGFGRLTHLMA